MSVEEVPFAAVSEELAEEETEEEEEDVLEVEVELVEES